MTILYAIASATLIFTPFIAFILLLAPLMNRKYLAGGRYFIWISVMAGLCLPFFSVIHRPAMQINVSVPIIADNRQVSLVNSGLPNTAGSELNQFTEGSENLKDVTDAKPSGVLNSLRFPTLDPPNIITFIWLAGVLFSLAYQAEAYYSFKRYLKRWSTAELDGNILEVFNSEISHTGCDKPIRLARCKGVNAPMLTGLIKPCILLPYLSYDDDDLRLILRHELTHYKRRDLWYKLALLFIKSIYWFNPAVYLMSAQANKDLEIICDALTVSRSDIQERKQYGEIILSMASEPHLWRSRLATCSMWGKRMLKQRLASVLSQSKANGAAVSFIIGAVMISAALMLGFTFVVKPAETTKDAANSLTKATYAEVSPSAENNVISADGNSDNGSSKNTQNSINSFSKGMKDFSQEMSTFAESMSGLSESIGNLSQEIANDINIADINGYSSYTVAGENDNINELKALVYDKAIIIEREFSNLTSLDIGTSFDSIKITCGGDKLKVRYYEWLDNEYSLVVADGNLSLKQDGIPYREVGFSSTNGWLWGYLQSQGKQPDNTVEIVLPANNTIKSVQLNTAGGLINIMDSAFSGETKISSASGKIKIGHSSFDKVKIEAASSDIYVGNIKANTVNVSAASGDITIEYCSSGIMDISTASGNASIKLADSAGNYNITFDSFNGELTYNGKKADHNALVNEKSFASINMSSAVGSFDIVDAAGKS